MKDLNNYFKSALKGLKYEFKLTEESFELEVWDPTHALDEEYILDKVENCLLGAEAFLDEKYHKDFEDEVFSDIWFSGFTNRKELGPHCTDRISFIFELG